MNERRKNRGIFPDLIFSKFFLVALIVIFLAVIFALAKGTIRNYKVNSEIADLETDIANLGKQNQELDQLIGYLKTDAYIEQEAKLKMGYKKPGENLVIIPSAQAESAEKREMARGDLSNLDKWLIYLFK